MAIHDVEEVVQETAARALASGITFTDKAQLHRWSRVVARRISVDLYRRSTHVGGELHDQAGDLDTALLAEQRVALAAALANLRRLSTNDQRLLLAPPDEEAELTRQERVRLSVARHRARNRLRSLMGGLATVGAWIAAARRRLGTGLSAAAVAAGPMLCAVVLMGSAGPGPSVPAAGGVAGEEVAVSQAVAAVGSGAVRLPSTGSAPAAPRGGAASPVPPAPVAQVDLSQPAGRETGTRVRPKEDGDPILSVSTLGGSVSVAVAAPAPVDLP